MHHNTDCRVESCHSQIMTNNSIVTQCVIIPVVLEAAALDGGQLLSSTIRTIAARLSWRSSVSERPTNETSNPPATIGPCSIVPTDIRRNGNASRTACITGGGGCSDGRRISTATCRPRTAYAQQLRIVEAMGALELTVCRLLKLYGT